MARRSRFNLLLLEEGEFLLEESTATILLCKPSGVPDSVEYAIDCRALGRLRLCTRSMSFEPDDHRLPILKFGFRSAPGAPVARTELSALPRGLSAALAAVDALDDSKVIVMQPSSAVEMKANNVIAPYKTTMLPDLSQPDMATPQSPSGRSGTMRSLITKATPKAAPSKPALAEGAASHVPGRTVVLFALQHAAAASLVPLAQQLWRIQRQCAAGAHSTHEVSALSAILDSRREGPFNMGLVSSFREKALLPALPVAVYAERIFPLVTCPGRVMVTDSAVYFMPVAINYVMGSEACSKWLLKDIRRVLRRRRNLQEIGLELVLTEAGAASSATSAAEAAGLYSRTGSMIGGVFLAFSSPAQRDNAYRCILKALREKSLASDAATPGLNRSGLGSSVQSDFDADLGDPPPAAIEALTRAWQERAVSNFDFISQLNSAAGRSTCDLTQYPVFPWIIKDYSSPVLDLASPESYRDLTKPVGALNEKRLAAARERFHEMPRGADADPPFIWGTHYSTPGYCLYFLVRSMPEHMLHLQAGRFDAPDRLFFDAAATWTGVTSINADVKELTPEFFSSDGSFLQLPDGLDLGIRATGRRVGDVQLPPWAFGAADFIERQREALESDVVSAQLHSWVDLIFGFKNRGPAAEASDNLFYYLSYDNAIDIEKVTDPERRLALQAQIAEFGQTPRQLYTHPHPSRGAGAPLLKMIGDVSSVCESSPRDIGGTCPADDASSFPVKRPSSIVPNTCQAQRRVSSIDAWKKLAWRRATFASSGLEADTRVSELESHEDSVTRVRAVSFGSANIGSIAIHVLSASRDGSVALYDIVVPPTIPYLTVAAAESSTLFSRCRIVPEAPPVEAPTQLSSLLLMWSALQGQVIKPKPLPVSAAACDMTNSVVVSACWDGQVFAHDATTGALLWHKSFHAAAISDIAFIPLSPSQDGLSTERYLIVTGAWDGSVGFCAVAIERHSALGTVSFRSCSTELLAPGIHTSAITAVAWCPAAPADTRTDTSSNYAFEILTADAGGVVAWLRVTVNAYPAPEPSAADALGLTADLMTRTSVLVNPAIARKGADPLSGGISGVTCLAATQEDAGILAAATTVDGRLCLFSGTLANASTPTSLSLLGSVATGEVLRCVAVDRAGDVVITGGHHCRLRLWDVARICSSSPQRELCSVDAELYPSSALSIPTSTGNVPSPSAEQNSALDIIAPSSVVPASLASKPWITSCAVVDIDSSLDPDRGTGPASDRSFCLLAGTNSGHLVVWTSFDSPTTAAALAQKNSML